MPTRWWIPVRGVDPHAVTIAQLHGAVTGWFDVSTEEHVATTKPYSVTWLADGGSDVPGLEVATLTEEATSRLEHTDRFRPTIRLGGQHGELGRPAVVEHLDWDDLGTWSGARAWALEFVSPVTFHGRSRADRRRERWMPWPAPNLVVRSLTESWNRWAPTSVGLTHQQVDELWVAEVDGISQAVPVAGDEVTDIPS